MRGFLPRDALTRSLDLAGNRCSWQTQTNRLESSSNPGDRPPVRHRARHGSRKSRDGHPLKASQGQHTRADSPFDYGRVCGRARVDGRGQQFRPAIRRPHPHGTARVTRAGRRCPPGRLAGAQPHRRHCHVRPEDSIEKQDDELGVLKPQVCRVLPERLDHQNLGRRWDARLTQWYLHSTRNSPARKAAEKNRRTSQTTTRWVSKTSCTKTS